MAAMRWQDLRTSQYMEDRRGGGGSGIPLGRGGLGIGTIIILALAGWALGIDPRILIGGAEMIGGGHAPQTQQVPQQRGGETTDEAGQFAGKILGNTEDVWKQVFPKQAGREYSPPKLILFSAGTRSRCGGPLRRWDRSTARLIRRCISTFPSSSRCSASSVSAGTSRMLT